MKKQLYLYTFTAALGGLLFGFDTAVISGTIPFITKHFQLDNVMLGWAVSSALLGCIVGAISVGKPADYIGRRNMLIIMAVLFFISAVGTAMAGGLMVFIIFRFIGGIGVGGASVISPMYISEISPAKIRGRMVATAQLAIVTGILSAFFSNYLLVNTGVNNWRWMFLAEAIPALAFFGMLFFVKRSPRWLVKVGRIEQAREVVAIVNDCADVDKTIDEISRSIDRQIFSHSSILLKKPYLRLVLIGIVVGMFNQLTGINAIMYYAPSIFKSAGFSNNSALIQTVIIGVTNLVFTVLAMSVIDRFGRKRLLIFGASGMTVFLGLFSWAYISQTFEGFFLLGSLIGFIACFAASQGVVIWVILSEMFPNNIRARASSIGAFSVWSFNAVSSFLFPMATARFGVGYVFIFYATATFISVLFFIKFLVETKGKSLEELEKILLK